MHPVSVSLNASDSKQWPAWNSTNAQALIEHPLAPEAAKNACRLLLGGMNKDKAIRAAAILLVSTHTANGYEQPSMWAMEDAIASILTTHKVIG